MCYQQADAGVWVEHFDKQSGKPFFYHSVSRETAWEAPAGAKVQYMNEAERGGGGSSGGGTAKAGSGNAWLVTLALMLPIALPMIGLLVCYCEPSRHASSHTRWPVAATFAQTCLLVYLDLRRRCSPAVHNPAAAVPGMCAQTWRARRAWQTC